MNSYLSRGLLIGLTICTLALPALPTAWAADQPTLAPDPLHLEQVQQQIESHQEKVEEAQIKALNLEQELNRIDSEIASGQATLRDLQSNLNNLEGFIEHKEEETRTIELQKEASAAHIEKRLAAFYQTGEVGIINALFSATDLGALLDLQEYVKALLQYDQKVLQSYREQIALLDKAKGELTASKSEMQALMGQVQEGEAALLQSRAERDALLSQARTEQELSRQAIQTLTDAAAKLSKTIKQSRLLEIKNGPKDVSRQPQTMAGTGAPISKFSAAQGQLPPPAPGQITRVFGPYQDQFGNELQSEGLDLRLPPKTMVTAMHPGRVIFADELPSYGKLIIIDHGEQYYSLVAGLASLARAKGDEVQTGDHLGLFEAAADQVNSDLHLEIRHGSTPIDPLLWIDPKQLE